MGKANAYYTLDDANLSHLKQELIKLDGIKSVSIIDNSISVDFDTNGTNCNEIESKIIHANCKIKASALQEYLM